MATFNLRNGGENGTAPEDNSQDPDLMIYAPLKALDATLLLVTVRTISAPNNYIDISYEMFSAGILDVMGGMIEEHTDFNHAVQGIIDYLDANTNGNNGENTLLIGTWDHDHRPMGTILIISPSRMSPIPAMAVCPASVSKRPENRENRINAG